MNKNKSDNNTEAIKIANALKPFVKNWFDEWGQSCVRSKKMTVTTAPNGSVIGVKDAFSETEIFIKYMSSCSNAVVGDTVWVKWMYDNMQTLFADRIGNFDRDNYVPVSGGTFTGDVSFNGVVDVTNRRSVALLSSAGWYRVCTYSVGSSGNVTGGHGTVVKFNIQKHTSSENHSITLRMASSSNIIWCDESSHSSTQLVDKIRYTYNSTSLFGYIDIHFTGTASRGICVYYDVYESGNDGQTLNDYSELWTSNNLTAVADAPSGETVVATHTFYADGIAPNIPINGDLILNGNATIFGHPMSYGLLYKGYAKSISTDFNDITSAGIYYLDNTTMTNAPDAYLWSYLLVMKNHGTVQITQMVVYTSTNGYEWISSRTYSGTTPTWGTWHSTYDNPQGNLSTTGITANDGNPSAVSVPTATWTTISSLTLTKGTWLVYATSRFASNATGYRRHILTGADTDTSANAIQMDDANNAVNGTYTFCRSLNHYTLTSNKTYYLRVYQNSGSSLSTTGRLYATKII